MRVIRYVSDLIEYISSVKGETLGLVPTMGCLHQGHLSLVAQARAENQQVAATIFVNPRQFNNAEDLDQYPDTLEEDLALLEEVGCDLVFCPLRSEIYPASFDATIALGGITHPLEGASRPGHFDGVTTIVSILFNLFQPTTAYFGQKDAQQLSVVKKLVRDLRFPVKVIGCPTVRDSGGLALSSRNTRLSEEQRYEAQALYKSLQWAEKQVLQGEKDTAFLREKMNQAIDQEPSAVVDYIAFTDPVSLEEVDVVEGSVLISLAVFVGPVRLIDNLLLTPAP